MGLLALTTTTLSPNIFLTGLLSALGATKLDPVTGPLHMLIPLSEMLFPNFSKHWPSKETREVTDMFTTLVVLV